MSNKVRRCVYAVAALPFLVAAYSSCAQAPAGYPSRPVRMVVPYAPGGGSDFVARIMQPALAEGLGQSIVIENRDGAGGNIGVELAARAEPNGYTLLLGNVSTMAVNPSLDPKLPIKPLRDLIPLTEVANAPSLVVANPGFPPNSLKEFVSYAKANPGKINYGSAGTGTVNWIEMESFKRLVGINMVHIPYKGGAGPAMIGLLANDTQVLFTTLSGGVSLVKQGRLKAFAVTSAHRVAVLPDVITMEEAGFKASAGSWQGVFLPRGTPPAIVQRLFTVVVKAMAAPEVKSRLADGGVESITSKSPADFFEMVKSETARFSTLIKEAGIVAN